MLPDHADLAATGFDQDDAAGLAAERAFDDHLLEKRMLLHAAACAPTSTRPVLLACECCCVKSVLDCLCGSGPALRVWLVFTHILYVPPHCTQQIKSHTIYLNGVYSRDSTFQPLLLR